MTVPTALSVDWRRYGGGNGARGRSSRGDTMSEAELTPVRRNGWILALRVSVRALMLGVLVWRLPSFSLSKLLPEGSVETAVFLTGARLLALVCMLTPT